MSNVKLRLDDYPNLKKLLINNQELFKEVLQGAMQHMDNAAASGRFEYSEEIYKRSYLQMLNEVMNAFFNPEGIAEQHYNESEKAGLRALGPNLHPLAIFTNGAKVYNAKGENISPKEWLGQDEFSLENWLYALFYGARFVSWKELSEYLSLGKYELVDVLKAHNFENLKHLQAELQKQEEKGIPKGKLIPGTGELDLGIKLKER